MVVGTRVGRGRGSRGRDRSRSLLGLSCLLASLAFNSACGEGREGREPPPPPFAPAVPGLPPPPLEVLRAQARLDLPPGFLRTEEGRVHGATDGAEMVLVPAGESVMGNDGERFAIYWGTCDGPEHRVSLRAYLVDRHPVTVGQWRRFLAATGAPAAAPPRGAPPPGAGGAGAEVPFAAAQRYAAGAGKSLPPEAQWEKAARGKDGRLLPWGDEDRDLPDEAVPVDALPGNASPYGVLGMAGGPQEWCLDRCGPSVADPRMIEPYASAPLVVEPQGADRGPWRIVRNGYFENSSTTPCGLFVGNLINVPLFSTTRTWRRPMDSSSRGWSPEDGRCGFRCVKRLER